MSEGKAFIVAVENYQIRSIPCVEFAEADARAVAESLKFSGLLDENIVILLSATATKTTIESKLKFFMRSVSEKDQLFFFYAGHGFASDGANYITCHDSQPEDLPNTSISLQNLYSHLRASHCRRIILFLDSCHSGVQIFQGMRELLVRRADSELQDLIEKDQYCVGFASCKSDEFSYSNKDLGQGIWTYHLARALRGDSSALIDNRFLTGLALQRFLLSSVQSTLKSMLDNKRVQTPCMFGNLTQDFVIADFAQGTGTPLGGWPEMTTDELNVCSSISAKAMEEPLTENDLTRLSEVVQSYHKRTGTECTDTQMVLGVWLNDAVLRYHFELGKCVLMAFDTKQPFFSQDLRKTIEQVRQLGLRESKIEADLRRILSCAYRTPWIDEFGRAYHPLTREEILDGMKRWEVTRDNFAKLFSLIRQWASTENVNNSVAGL
jgi:hypothetical protein